MATVSPVMTPTSEGVPRIIWEGVATGDTLTAYAVQQQYGLAASIQISGTFGGATVTLQHSNDGSTWFTATDMFENVVTATSDSMFEVSLSSAYFRPAISGGSSNDVDVILVLRGNHGV